MYDLTFLFQGSNPPKHTVRSLREATPMHYILHVLFLLFLFAGLYCTHFGVRELEEAQVFKVANKYVIKRKNLKKYAYLVAE